MKENVILYFQQYEAIKHLSLEDKGRLLDAIFSYAIIGELTNDLPPLVEMAFSFIRTSMDLDTAKYKQKCERNRETANMRWNANACVRMHMNTNDANTNTNTQLPLTNDQNEEPEKRTTTTIDNCGIIETPPDDRAKRNLSALNRRLFQLKASTIEMQEIYELSNYGQIGNPIWKLFDTIDKSNGQIKLPVKFILSRLKS
jgi:hypothetical protein